MFGKNKRAWNNEMKYALWAYRISVKRLTGKLPYELVYGENAIFPFQLENRVIQLLVTEEENPIPILERLNNLVELEAKRFAFITTMK